MKRIIGLLVLALSLSCYTAGTTSEAVLDETAGAATHGPVIERVAGGDMKSDICQKWQICGTDLGIATLASNGSVIYTLGDTFPVLRPEDSDGTAWRSPVMVRSNSDPRYERIVFDNAAGIRGAGVAPEVTRNGHHRGGEVSFIPNDLVVLPDGRYVLWGQSIQKWLHHSWRTNYSQLAVSTDGGNSFQRKNVRWSFEGGVNAFQMGSMQLDGEYIYRISVRAGRTEGPMVLSRVKWREVLNPKAYYCWDGADWSKKCRAIAHGTFGEPSLRKLSDGTWAMSYLDIDKRAIVTRTAYSPSGPWSEAKVQLRDTRLPSLYGGFIHPYSTRKHLVLMVSSWQRNAQGRTTHYEVYQVSGLNAFPHLTTERM